jgi:hypothetical protein
MGLLDDAIREHLELKRRRGADPTDIARAEQEALGPVRRERPASAEEPGHDELPEHGDDAESLRESEPRAGDDDLAAPAFTPGSPPAPEPEDATRVMRPDDHAPDGHAAHTPPTTPADEPQRHEPPPAPEHTPDDPRRSEIVDQPTTEYLIEDLDEEHPAVAPPAQSAPQPPPAPERDDDAAEPRDREPDWHADEDVLEETPDFLQETPEHDRLWFEQRPPRDFDFDG